MGATAACQILLATSPLSRLNHLAGTLFRSPSPPNESALPGEKLTDAPGCASLDEKVVDEQSCASLGEKVVDGRSCASLGEKVVDGRSCASLGEKVVDGRSCLSPALYPTLRLPPLPGLSDRADSDYRVINPFIVSHAYLKVLNLRLVNRKNAAKSKKNGPPRFS